MTTTNDRNIMQIMILDQGIIQFNAKPRDGIAFLIKNKVIPGDNLEVAKFLATADKLDKHVLGNFLGKDNDFSVAILNQFASLFHYEGVPFDIALRAFTNRFAMPGESQMIYRILERFAVYYSKANPELDKDKALILSYALIMLNVDLHSTRVKAKMTRDEFVRNTELALGNAISRDELEQMYYRILSKEFKPDTSAEEIVYSKLAVNPKYSAKGAVQSGEASAQVVEQLKNGAILLKYGREGTPHPRKVFLSSDGKKLCWIDPKKLEKLEKKQLRKIERERSNEKRKEVQSARKATSQAAPRVELDESEEADSSEKIEELEKSVKIDENSVNIDQELVERKPDGDEPVDPDHEEEKEDADKSVDESNEPMDKIDISQSQPVEAAPPQIESAPSPPPAEGSEASLDSPRKKSTGGFKQTLKELCSSKQPSPPEVISSPLRAGELVTGNNDLDFIRAAFIKVRSRGAVPEESFKREIALEDITGLVVGTGGTSNLRRHFQAFDDVETEQRCFSIITDYRTLDLQAPSGVDIQPWLHFFHSVLSAREKRLRALADKNKDIWSFTQKERASLVRWQEIVPQWSDHWNCGARVSAGGGYRASQHPKEELLNHRMFFVNPSGFVLDRGQRLETAVSPQLVALWLEGIPSSVRPRIWPIATGNNLRIDDSYFQKILARLMEDRKNLTQNVPPLDLNVSVVVESLDQSVAPSVTESVFYNIAGAPQTPSRAAIPPLGEPSLESSSDSSSFEKQLERELKSSSMRKFANRALSWIDARGSREQQAFFKPSVELSEYGRMGPRKNAVGSPIVPFRKNEEESVSEAPNGDSDGTKSQDSWDSHASPMNSGWENVYEATKLIVSCFLTQRKDIKYVRGMAVLASMVIFNVGIHDLSRTFTVFANLMHQHYFFDFFTLRWRDMRMRFDLYGKLLRERMPYLDDHFSAIQITSDLYFNQWLLTGFTRVLPFRTVCRVWDGFLLLGESYLFTAALALLNYYEHSLMTSGFSGCLEILLGHADEVLFNDKKFFDCVQLQSVSNERFAAWLSAQRLAEEKTALYDLLLLM